jgi:hypothetical protein
VRIYEENGNLMAQGDGQAAVRMASQGNNVWTGQGIGRVTFDIVDGKGVGFVQGTGARTNEAVRVP